MSLLFEELDFRATPIGDLSLRRRRELQLGIDVIEIKLGDEFLMSDLFTESEIALAKLGLAELDGKNLDIVVGGLGLGYTAKEVLADDRVGSLVIVDALDTVIDWHKSGLLPLGKDLTEDSRNRYIHGNFFDLAQSAGGFDPDMPGRQFDGVIVDIDHSPAFLLSPDNAPFYEPAGLEALKQHIKPGGVFALWSNDLPDDDFTKRLAGIYKDARAETVTFQNPIQHNDFTQTIYLATA